MKRLPRFKWSLRSQFIAIGVLAAFLAAWLSLGRPFAFYGALVLFVMWVGDHLSLTERTFFALLLLFIASITVPVSDWFVYVIAGPEYGNTIAYARGEFWLGLAAALFVPGLVVYVRTKLFQE